MHIIHTVSSTENLSSGVTHCVNELSYGLKMLGQQVEILSLGSLEKPSYKNISEYKFENNFSKIPILRNIGFSSCMKKYILSSKSNIIHTHGLWRFPNIYRNNNAVFVISPHGMLAVAALKFSPKQKKIFHLLFQKSAFADAKLIFATAESEMEDIRRYGLKMPIALISNGVNIPKIKKTNRNSKIKTLISLGRIHPQKGLDVLISAWSRIEPFFKDWQLKIVGPDEVGHKKILEKLINKLKLTRVFIEDPVYRLDKDILLSNCNLFILPSKSENFALTIAESLAVEVPVIATRDTPWSGLDLNRCGWWIAGTEDAIVSTLRNALSFPDKQLLEMGRRGKKWMEKDFSWDKTCQKTKEAYEWLTKMSKKPEFIYT